MEDKFCALNRLDAGATAKKIATNMGVGTSTVSDWMKGKSDIEKWCSSRASTSGMKKLKIMKKATNTQISEALYLSLVHPKKSARIAHIRSFAER